MVNVRSLRFKLIWIHGLAIALVVVLIGLVRYKIVSYRSQQSFDADLLDDARFFLSRFQFETNGFTWATNGLSPGVTLSLQELQPYFVVTHLQGQVLRENLHSEYMQAMLHRGGLEMILRQRSGFGQAAAPDGELFRFVSLPLPPGISPMPAIMHIGRSMEALRGVLNEYVIFYFYSVPLILAISVAVGWFLAGRALRPFEQIARTAGQITSENLNTQIVTNHREEEVQKLVQSFNAMVRRLNLSFQQMRKFNADAAHELRTPLAILQGETEVAMRSPNLPEEIHSVLASNLEELDRLTRIVNDMLTLAEAEAGSQVLVKEPVNLKVLIEDLVDQMRLLATDRNIQIQLLDLPEAEINADKLWIRRAIINLLDNAIKYSKVGDKVDVWGIVEGPLVRLGITDHGIGIAAADLPHIFDRLYRADPARTRGSGGMGLGLALVKWIVEAHNGVIQVTSQPDLGATFEIIFPASTNAASNDGCLRARS